MSRQLLRSLTRFQSPLLHQLQQHSSPRIPVLTATKSGFHQLSHRPAEALSCKGISPGTRRNMATNSSQTFTGTVLTAVRKLFPEELADSSWDNTGLLLDEAPPLVAPKTDASGAATVFLTNDLTPAVVNEALQEGAKVIICYHPVIFRPLKSITTQDPMQTSLLRLAADRVSVYCPHTAMDAASGGLNDWLCDMLVAGEAQTQRTVVEPIKRPVPEGHEGSGYGRTVEMANPVSLTTLIKRLSAGVGGQRYIMVALPPALGGDVTALQQLITKFAVCAGSGSGVLRNSDAQVLVTGEMSHHDALRHAQLGQIVLTVFHSNSERKYLEQRLKPMIEVQLETTQFARTRVVVSKADRDPFEIIDVESLP